MILQQIQKQNKIKKSFYPIAFFYQKNKTKKLESYGIPKS